MKKTKELIQVFTKKLKILMAKIRIFLHLNPPVPKASEKQKTLFDSLNPGDIVLSIMPLNEIEMERIRKTSGHTIRPYLVAKRKGDMIYAYQCSSKKHKNSSRQQYKLPQSRYNLYKREGNDLVPTDSYIDLSKPFILNPGHLQWYMYTVEEADLEMIERKLIAEGKKNLIHFDVPFRVVEGDIYLNNDQYYYVYQYHKNNLFCYRLEEVEKENHHAIHIGDRYYTVVLTKKYTIKLEESRLVCIANPNDKKWIVKQLEAQKKQKIQAKTEEKKKSKDNAIYYKADIGNVYKSDDNGRLMIYMYSYRKRNYGVDYQLLTDFDRIKVKAFFTSDLNTPEFRVEDDELMFDLMDAMVENNGKLADFFEEHYVCRAAEQISESSEEGKNI